LLGVMCLFREVLGALVRSRRSSLARGIFGVGAQHAAPLGLYAGPAAPAGPPGPARPPSTSRTTRSGAATVQLFPSAYMRPIAAGSANRAVPWRAFLSSCIALTRASAVADSGSLSGRL